MFIERSPAGVTAGHELHRVLTPHCSHYTSCNLFPVSCLKVLWTIKSRALFYSHAPVRASPAPCPYPLLVCLSLTLRCLTPAPQTLHRFIRSSAAKVRSFTKRRWKQAPAIFLMHFYASSPVGSVTLAAEGLDALHETTASRRFTSQVLASHTHEPLLCVSIIYSLNPRWPHLFWPKYDQRNIWMGRSAMHFKCLGVSNKVMWKTCFSYSRSEVNSSSWQFQKAPVLFSSYITLPAQRGCQTWNCITPNNAALRAVHSHLIRATLTENAVGWIRTSLYWPGTGNTKGENEMEKKGSWRERAEYSTAFGLSTLCACTLIVCALKVRMFGFETFLAEFSLFYFSVTLLDRAVPRGCCIKRHFVFFLSLTHSQPRLRRSERETERGRWK